MISVTCRVNKPANYTENIVFRFIGVLFLSVWIYFCATAIDRQDWWLENILVICFVFGLIVCQKRFMFCDKSLVFIFVFLLLHIYGARTAYTQNELGEILRNIWNLDRNPYDRIVHFSFGFFMAYPFTEFFQVKFAVAKKYIFVLVTMAILSFATIFELIEWGVAACTDSATGETYVATQGDPWDAQKDTILAVLGAVIFMRIQRQISKLFDK